MLVVEEENSNFKVEFIYESGIDFLPFFEIYGKHLVTFNP